jgi:hypothetical protein
VSLYVRVFSSFYTHRKTLRLQTIIGEAAFWVPPKLWSYACENQPDGIFEQYTAEEMALLIGYKGEPQALLEALLKSGLLDANPLRIHDWEEHNGYHSTFSERAKKAAEARWGKKRIRPCTEKKGQDRKGKETSIASSMLKASHSNEPVSKSLATLEEVKTFGASEHFQQADLEWFYHKCVGNGWTNGGKPIKDWKATLRAWKAAGYLPSQKATHGTNQQNHRNGTRPPTGAEQRSLGIPESDGPSLGELLRGKRKSGHEVAKAPDRPGDNHAGSPGNGDGGGALVQPSPQ